MALTLIDIILIATLVTGLLGTITVSRISTNDRRVLQRANAMHRDMAQFVAENEARRANTYKTFQLINHTLITFALLAWVVQIPHLVFVRNVILLISWSLMSLSSAIYLVGRRQLVAMVKRHNEQSKRERDAQEQARQQA